MKFFKNLLFFTFILISLQNSQAQDNPNFVYTIQIGAFDNADITDFDDIRTLGYVYSYPLRDNLRQVFLGGYTNKKAAKEVLPQLQQWGYPDAYVMRKAYDEGEEVASVLVGTERVGKDINYGKYFQAGKIFIIQKNDQVHIMSGQHSSISIAEKRAVQLKKLGFINATATTANTVQLIKVTDFESGGISADPIIAMVDTPKGDVKAEVKKEEIKKEKKPKQYDVLFKKSKNTAKGTTKKKVKKEKPKTTIPEDIPETYEVTSKRIVVAPKKKKEVSLPKIRVSQKRTSAIELQKILKAEGAYTGSLDGYYGKGTAAGYEAIKKQNKQIKKYLLWSKMEEESTGDATNNRLQKVLNTLLDAPNDTDELLKAERSPLAKVYRAYISFETKGQSKEVNQLMNSAIQQSFSGKKLKNTPPFDYKSKYAYDDISQLLKHMSHIHVATGDAAAPCWIFDQHPNKANEAFASTANSARVMTCGGDFFDWEEAKLIKAIAEDLDRGATENKNLEEATSQRALLFSSPKKLSASEVKAALTWHKSLWLAMDNWANTDPLHDQRVTALKIAYFQTQVRLEDYFMNKKFTYKEAKPLAMLALKSMIGNNLADYME